MASQLITGRGLSEIDAAARDIDWDYARHDLEAVSNPDALNRDPRKPHKFQYATPLQLMCLEPCAP